MDDCEGSRGRADGLLWHKDLGSCMNGQFSMAVMQANRVIEDQSQLESGPLSGRYTDPYGTIIGVYDGHGGPQAAQFVARSLLLNVKSTFFLLLKLLSN